MIKWKVLKKAKNYKRAVHNLMFFHNWRNAVKYVYKDQQKKNKEIESVNTPFGICGKTNIVEPWEETVRFRLEQLDSEQSFPIERRC